MGISILINCASLITDFFFIGRRQTSYKGFSIPIKRRSFDFTFRYIDDVLSLNNNCIDHIYLIDLQIKDTTDTDRSASYLDLHLKIDSEG